MEKHIDIEYNKNEMIIKILDTDVSSRSNARVVREMIISHLDSNKQDNVLIDIRNVLMMSNSYADELFGVLVKYSSLEFLTKKIILIKDPNQDDVLSSIIKAISRRNDER